MFSKRRRITRQEFPSGRDGQVFHATHFSLRAVSHADVASRFSVVVSKKVARTAVARDKLKRRVYVVFRRSEKNTPISPGRYVLFAKKNAPELSFKELEVEIKNLLFEYSMSEDGTSDVRMRKS